MHKQIHLFNYSHRRYSYDIVRFDFYCNNTHGLVPFCICLFRLDLRRFVTNVHIHNKDRFAKICEMILVYCIIEPPRGSQLAVPVIVKKGRKNESCHEHRAEITLHKHSEMQLEQSRT